MGGKGRRRREKNFIAAHGGYSRLPPPPNLSKVDALPGKLRQLMALTSQSPDGSAAPSKSVGEKRKRRGGGSEKDQNTSEAKSDGGDIVLPEQIDEGVHGSGDERGKKKRKKKQANDLRFETILDNTKTSQRKRERRKKYFESKKKKHKQPKEEDNVDFPRHERIEFGDVVQAPPKLLTIPKAHKNVAGGASQERIRLQAIEAYRKRKGWTSRPGLQLPSLNPAPSL